MTTLQTGTRAAPAPTPTARPPSSDGPGWDALATPITSRWTEPPLGPETDAGAGFPLDILTAVLDTVPALVVLADTEGVPRFVNRAAVQYTGLPLEELVGQGLEAVVPLEDLEQSGRPLALRGLADTPLELVHRVRRADGALRSHVIRHSPVTGPNGSILYRISTALDIEDLVRTRDELEAANRAKDELLGLIAHELRSPLATVLAAARRLNTSGAVQVEERDTVQALVRNSDRLAMLIDNMLILAHGDQPVELEPLLLQRLLPHSAAAHRERFPDRTLHFDVPAGLPMVVGHAGWIGQVMENFMGNAEKYSPPETEIAITAVVESGAVSVRVLDRGSGIPADRASRLFDAFHREQATEGVPGLGLGLAVCKRLVEQQDGQVWAAPRPGGGSEFGFALKALE